LSLHGIAVDGPVTGSGLPAAGTQGLHDPHHPATA
jgi:hypothetical protein